MDDLVRWLTEVWDEEEAAARAGGRSGFAWKVYAQQDADDDVHVVSGWEIGAEDGRLPGYVRVAELQVYNGENQEDLLEFTHIVRHDPASVLARIAADRKILELHTGGVSYPDECGLCNEALPCQTVRLLGSVHADRPGYRDEWRV